MTMESAKSRKLEGNKRRLNLKLDPDLADFAFAYAAKYNTSVTQIITDFLVNLKNREECRLEKDAEQI